MKTLTEFCLIAIEKLSNMGTPTIKSLTNKLLSKYKMLGNPDPVMNSDTDFQNIYYKCKPYTMTSPLRMYALYQAVKYVSKAGIEGDFVECGVWKGGSSMVIAMTLKLCGIENRKIYLYDTFGGMSEPSVHDVEVRGGAAADDEWKKSLKSGYSTWCYSPLEEVESNMGTTGYPKKNIIFIKGKVEDTIPGTLPKSISLLRLDTDFYESTKHEMEHLYPLLSAKGVLLIDDYGHWGGARKAVDDYINNNNINILLNRVDYTGRIAVKG